MSLSRSLWSIMIYELNLKLMICFYYNIDNSFKKQIGFNMPKGVITVSLSSSSDKLRQNFPQDPKGDVQIIYKSKTFRLQKAHLRLQSSFFRKNLTSDRSILQIDQNFNEEFFTKILQCFYGASLQVNRKDALVFFLIAEYLEIQSIVKTLRKDMAQNTSQYNFFELFDLAYRISDQTIFEKCLLQLQYHDFAQIKSHRQDLFTISEELFKLIVKTHNRAHKSKRVLNAYQINNLISDYCNHNKFTNEHKNALKFQLIDKINLSSQQYKDIFIKEGNASSAQQISFRKNTVRAMSLSPMRSQPQFAVQNYQNLSFTMQYQKTMALEMDTTFQKKISQQLLQQKNKIACQIADLNSATINQTQKNKTIRQQFTYLRRTIIDEKQNKQKSLDKKIKSIDCNLSSLEKDLSDQSVRLKNLIDSTQQMMNKYDAKQKDKLSVSLQSGSSYWDKKQNPKNNAKVDFGFNMQTKSNKSYQNISNISGASHTSKSESQIKIIDIPILQNDISQISIKNRQDFYNKEKRLEFSGKSNIIQNLKQLNTLADLICPDRFSKKKLKFLYGSSKQNIKSPSRIAKQTPQISQSIRSKTKNKKNILFLLRTQDDKIIGGFASVPLNLYLQGDIQDPYAYIFTVTENMKFKVRAQQKQDAIMVNDGYIICFGSDLMISDKIFEQQNYCGWPNTYHGHSQLKERGSDWFAGNSQFAAKQIQCYQIQTGGSQMIL